MRELLATLTRRCRNASQRLEAVQWGMYLIRCTLQSVLGASAAGSHPSHGSRADRSCLECQRGPLLRGGTCSFRAIQTIERTPANTTSRCWTAGQSVTGQTFQIPLHLTPTARGEASNVDPAAKLDHKLIPHSHPTLLPPTHRKTPDSLKPP